MYTIQDCLDPCRSAPGINWRGNYMRRLFLSFAIFIAFFTLNKAYAQSTYSSGNLLRIPFDCRQINTADTIKTWNENNHYSTSSNSDSYTKYFDHITTPLRSYFLKKYEFSSNSSVIEVYEGKQIVENENLLNNRQFGFLPGPGWDVPEPFMLDRTIVIETKNGLWLNNGAFRNAFLFYNDSLLQFNQFYPYGPNTAMADLLKAIVGKVNDKYMAVFTDQYSRGIYNHFLINTDDSPNIDSAKSVKVSIIGDSTFSSYPMYYHHINTISRIRKITGDLYAVTTNMDQGLRIFRYSGTAFYHIKTLLKDEFQYSLYRTPQWEIRNGRLFLLRHSEIVCYDFNSSDTSFINRKVLLSSLSYPSYYRLTGISANFGIDRNMKYAAKIFKGPEGKYQDTLKLFDIDKGVYFNSIVLNSIKDSFMPVVDSPYVYLHQIKYQYTGIDDNPNIIVNDYTLSAYPNPFNASVKITYSLPENINVEINIYDLLGRKLETLQKGPQTRGDHFVMFNASNLPSGIYLYSMTAGNRVLTNKLLLLK